MSGVVQTATFTATITVPGNISIYQTAAIIEERTDMQRLTATSGESADAAVAALRDFAFQILKAITPEGTEYPAPPWVGK